MTSQIHSDAAVTIWHADARHLPLPDESVDLVVTSPPYFGLRSYEEDGEHYDGQIGYEDKPAEFVDALVAATREMIRVTKSAGSIWVNLGDRYTNRAGGKGWGGERTFGGDTERAGEKIRRRTAPTRRDMSRSIGMPEKTLIGIPWRYAIRCIDELGLILRAEVIWSKPGGMPESVRERARRTHETWFHFTRSPRHFSCVDDPDGSVWSVPTQPLRVPGHLPQHFAAFPVELPRRIIRGWCPDGGVVLDPFGGTGTTALAAKVLGRRAHHVDLSRDYCRLATWRVNDPGEIARAMQVEKPPPAPEDMGSLLDLLEGAS